MCLEINVTIVTPVHTDSIRGELGTWVPFLFPSAITVLVVFVIMIRTSTPGRGTPTAPEKHRHFQ